jgi:hypothetical protein
MVTPQEESRAKPGAHQCLLALTDTVIVKKPDRKAVGQKTRPQRFSRQNPELGLTEANFVNRIHFCIQKVPILTIRKGFVSIAS